MLREGRLTDAHRSGGKLSRQTLGGTKENFTNYQF
jgi:hypothetical protein